MKREKPAAFRETNEMIGRYIQLKTGEAPRQRRLSV